MARQTANKTVAVRLTPDDLRAILAALDLSAAKYDDLKCGACDVWAKEFWGSRTNRVEAANRKINAAWRKVSGS